MLAEDELRRALSRLPLVDIAGLFHRVIRLQYSCAHLKRTRTLGVLDAIGSRLSGGRFNLKGSFEVLYLACDALTAELEAGTILFGSGVPQRGRHAEPTVHVGVVGTIHGILDLTDEEIIKALGTSETELKAPWRMIQAQGAEAPTQFLGRLAWETRRIEALRYWSSPSTQNGQCVAIFPDRLAAPSEVTVIDDSGRLAPERLPKRRTAKRPHKRRR